MWLGIDFSGDYRKWGAGVRRGPVWIATITERDGKLLLEDLRRVQDFHGAESPFVRLQQLLQHGAYAAAAIDAPFSVPERFVPNGGHIALLQLAGSLQCGRRPFPEATHFVSAIAHCRPPLSPPKPLRHCECLWQKKRVNVRSTLYAGPRGGAAMTAGCLRLLANVKRPLWPWTSSQTRGFLAEAFPAAQLRHWGWPHEGYNGLAGEVTRREIVGRLLRRVKVSNHHTALLGSADAIDAVLCAVAARGITTGNLAVVPNAQCLDEGWIAVHA
jgi:hypothetical protein